jgi:hypothetical protein
MCDELITASANSVVLRKLLVKKRRHRKKALAEEHSFK